MAAAGRRSPALLSTLNYWVVLPRWCCAVPACHDHAMTMVMALHARALRFGPTQPVTDFCRGWQMGSIYRHCGRAKRSRISDTHRLRSSLQFRYTNNNQSSLFSCRRAHLDLAIRNWKVRDYPQINACWIWAFCVVINSLLPIPQELL